MRGRLHIARREKDGRLVCAAAAPSETLNTHRHRREKRKVTAASDKKGQTAGMPYCHGMEYVLYVGTSGYDMIKRFKIVLDGGWAFVSPDLSFTKSCRR